MSMNVVRDGLYMGRPIKNLEEVVGKDITEYRFNESMASNMVKWKRTPT